MKVFTDLYKAFAASVEAELKEDIKWFDWWRNQISVFEEEYPFALPAIFISIDMSNAESMGDEAKSADTVVELYVGKETLARSNSKSKTMDKALEFAQLLDKVFALFEGWKSDCNQPLEFVGLQQIETASHVQLYKLTFTTLVTFKASTIEKDNFVEDPLGTQSKAAFEKEAGNGEQLFDIG